MDTTADEQRLRPYEIALDRAGTRTPDHPTRADVSLLSADFHADPLDHLAWMRREAPVYWDDATGIWGVTRHADVMRVEQDWQTFCSGQGSRPTSSVPSMINMDPPGHTDRRRLVAHDFAPRRVQRHEAFLRRTVGALLDEVIESGRCELVGDIATAIPLRMIAELMGLPAEDYDRLVHWSDLFATGGDEVRDQVVTAVEEYAAYVLAHCDERRRTRPGDLLDVLVHAEPGGEALSPDDLVYESMLILVGGDETTRHVMSGGLEALVRRPDQLAALRADRRLLPGAIEEMLRWTTPVRNMNRTATVDVVLGGQSVRAGDRLLLLYLSANRDEAVFDRPDDFDVRRHPNPHVAFGGKGRHFCLGAHLARLELRVLLEEVLDRLHDLAIDDAGEVRERRGNFVLGLEELPLTFRPGPRLLPAG